MSTEREANNQDAQAPHGAYEFLEQIGNYLFIDPINHTRVWVGKEPVCAETGGSCMDLTIREGTSIRKHKDYHAHITQDGKIACLKTYLWDLDLWNLDKTSVFQEGPTPDIKDMLSTIKNLLSRKDIKKYPR